MTNYNLKVFNSKQDCAAEASMAIAQQIHLALSKKHRSQISLCGGSTPLYTYNLLAKELLPWQRVDLFLGDERWVDQSDELSNSNLIRNTFFSLNSKNKPVFHPIPTLELPSPIESSKVFSKMLSDSCNSSPPVFDAVLLGLGEDGHTASLFPFSKSLQITNSWATVSFGNGIDRITVTHPVLSAAKKVIFLITGESKQTALARLLDVSESSERTPAKLVQPNSEILIIADKNAAALI